MGPVSIVNSCYGYYLLYIDNTKHLMLCVGLALYRLVILWVGAAYSS